MTFIHEKIRIACSNVQGQIVTANKGIPGVEYTPCGYKTGNTPPADADWKPYSGGELTAPPDSHFWFRFKLDVPVPAEGREYRFCATTGREGQWDARNPQCIVYIDSESAYQAFDTNHTWTPVEPGSHDVAVYYYTGMDHGSTHLNFSLKEIDLATERLWYDLSVPYNAMKCLPADSSEYAAICNALDRATMLLDFRRRQSPEFFASVKEAIAFMQREFYDKLNGGTGMELALIGHTHIDVAWMWTLAQTREKAQRSFATVIRLMERYPDYVFMSSQPQLYEYVKEQDPELYAKIKERIAEGRWEVEGAMWLESDTNLVSGESLIRQILYGKKFMKKEFGADNKILWLPDVFGYSAALPQILKKSGVPQFFTTKISWCETDTFPHDNFIWQGIDGSEVFAVLSDAYVKRLEPAMIRDSWKKHVDKKYSNTHICTFGFGDGGGGPTAEMLENYERLKKGLPGFPKLTMKKSGQTIDEIEAEFTKNAEELRFLPKWSGELYLEMHRGTYTSIAKNKKNNRLSEYAYQHLETLSVLDELTGGEEYPKEMIDKNWHTILKNQFHDIIPGSSIKQVYDDSDVEYAQVLGDAKALFDEKLDRVASKITTSGGLLVYNPSPVNADGLIETENGPILMKDIPAHGWRVINPKAVAATVTATDTVIENEQLRVTFGEKMHIVSIWDKSNDREVLTEGAQANVLEVYEDYPRSYDAWEITEYYKQKMWVADDVSGVEVINEGVRAGVKITRRYGDSTIVQTITLREGSARLDFATDVDWHEDHVLLKAAFPFDVRASHANYEIQFGHIERPTHRNTSWDQAKFEVSAHKWADLSDAGYGVSILNDCKYGYSCEENVMRISLLKAATYPNPEADRGQHHFTYSVYPHKGGVGSDTIREAYMLNNPLVSRVLGKQEGSLPACYALVDSSDCGFLIDTVKKAEDGSGIIIRGYESRGAKVSTRLIFGFSVKKAELCDLMENVIAPVPCDGRCVDVKAGSFEIVTIKVTV
ncbi:MAG: alpha-mannosidase [Clostridia bacterium]|nr:alpha-mannosidase [Clostridia bacterium]